MNTNKSTIQQVDEFFLYDREISEITDGISSFFQIVGGRSCGKTIFLKKLSEAFNKKKRSILLLTAEKLETFIALNKDLPKDNLDKCGTEDVGLIINEEPVFVLIDNLDQFLEDQNRVNPVLCAEYAGKLVRIKDYVINKEGKVIFTSYKEPDYLTHGLGGDGRVYSEMLIAHSERIDLYPWKRYLWKNEFKGKFEKTVEEIITTVRRKKNDEKAHREAEGQLEKEVIIKALWKACFELTACHPALWGEVYQLLVSLIEGDFFIMSKEGNEGKDTEKILDLITKVKKILRNHLSPLGTLASTRNVLRRLSGQSRENIFGNEALLEESYKAIVQLATIQNDSSVSRKAGDVALLENIEVEGFLRKECLIYKEDILQDFWEIPGEMIVNVILAFDQLHTGKSENSRNSAFLKPSTGTFKDEGVLELNIDGRSSSIHLENYNYRLINLLLQEPGKVYSPEQIGKECSTKNNPSKESVRSGIKRLQETLNFPGIIESVRGKGYRFVL